MQTPCGNCGKPVGGSDITCPHCDVLLAAYASPTGATPVYTSEPTASVADAVAPVEISEPAPAPKIEIPDGIEAGSTAPRPLFDTNVTIEELMEAAESDDYDPLVLASEGDTATKATAFDVPDYAKPPSGAAPVPVIEDADEQMIARPVSATDKPSEPDVPGEHWLADAHEGIAPARTVRKARPTPAERREEAEPGHTEAYLRKLHTRTGYESAEPHLTRPVDARTSRPALPIAGALANDATMHKSRQGCMGILYVVLLFLWISVIAGMLDGDLKTGVLLLAITLTIITRLLNKLPANLGTK